MTATQTPLVETFHTGGFMVSEANGMRSRGQGILVSGAIALAGTVLGLIANGTVGAAAAVAGNTGNGTVGTVTEQAGAQVGTYRVEFIAATKFNLTDPSGALVGEGTTGVAFANQLGFTITAGGTAFVAGDAFTIAVAAGSGKYTPVNSAAVDGSQNAAAISWGYQDAATVAADKPIAVILRSCEVNASELVWPNGASGGQIAAWTAQLAKLGIISR